MKLYVVYVIFSEDIIGSKYTSVKAANQIHVCNNTAVTGEVVMIHSFNVSRSISSCSCSVRLPTGADKVPVHYTIPKRERQNCGIKFSLDTNTDFLCEPKSVKRTSLKGIHFSRDRNANAKASLLIKVGKFFDLFLIFVQFHERLKVTSFIYSQFCANHKRHKIISTPTSPPEQ